jgi:sugar O-acyltransferase (sialic acid O-acetyltransferase NeuD family)
MRALLLGKGGHARLLQSLAPHYHFTMIEAHEEEAARAQPPLPFANGIGVVKADLSARIAAYQRFMAQGFSPLTLISKHALFEGAPQLGQGVQIMAGVIVQPHVVIGENCVINTGATLDHDCTIGAHSFIAPRALLCGGVAVGEGVFLGAGCIIFPNVKIKAGAVIAAGAIIK